MEVQNFMLKKNIFTAVFVMLIIVCLIILSVAIITLHKDSVSKKVRNNIISEIESQCPSDDGTCEINLKELTDFEWDKIILYQISTSKHSIENALGFEFKETKDFDSGIIFVKNNKIICNIKIFEHPDNLYIPLRFVIEDEDKFFDCAVLYYDNAILKAEKQTIDGHKCYIVSA